MYRLTEIQDPNWKMRAYKYWNVSVQGEQKSKSLSLIIIKSY